MSKNHYYSNTSAFDESIRTLRTNIQFSEVDRKLKTILVTSTNPSEGKSTIALELAKSFALNGDKVLLMDCDLRNPTVSKISGIKNNVGITNILTTSIKVGDAITSDENTPGLDVILSGPIPPNPSELLGSNAMERLLDLLKGAYDHIIVDTPPVNLITDAAILSTKVDGTLLVVNHGSTKKEDLQNAIRNIEQVGGNVIGACLNMVPIKHKKYGYGYGYGYY